MGLDVRLISEIPIRFVTFKRFNERKTVRQSELQNLGLWQCGRHQYVMFFANCTARKHKEMNGTCPLGSPDVR